MKNTNIEVEGGEILIQSKEGHYAVIPAKDRQKALDMVKDGCDDCINSYIQGLPKEADYAEDGTLLPSWDKVKATLNPYNWGVTDYTDKGTRGQAYNAARKAGEKEFMWNNQRFNTNYDGTPTQQLKETGITDKQLQNRNFIQNRLSNNLNPRGYELAVKNDGKIYERIINTAIKNKREKAREEENVNRLDAFNLYTGKPQTSNTFRISNYKPSKSKDAATIYYSLNNVDNYNFLDYLDDNGEIKDYSNLTPDQRYDVNLMGNYKVNKGEDERGMYISYYDKWDLNPLSLKNPITGKETPTDFGKPFEIYDRVYIKDYGDGKQKRMYYSDKELSELDVNKRNFDTQALQRELSNRGIKLPKSTTKEGTFDGIWGDETKQALLDYQTKNKKK